MNWLQRTGVIVLLIIALTMASLIGYAKYRSYLWQRQAQLHFQQHKPAFERLGIALAAAQDVEGISYYPDGRPSTDTRQLEPTSQEAQGMSEEQIEEHRTQRLAEIEQFESLLEALEIPSPVWFNKAPDGTYYYPAGGFIRGDYEASVHFVFSPDGNNFNVKCNKHPSQYENGTCSIRLSNRWSLKHWWLDLAEIRRCVAADDCPSFNDEIFLDKE